MAHIREAGLEDAATLAELHRACFQDAWDAASFSRLLEGQGSFALLAEHKAATESQAFALFRIAADEAEILSLATRPHLRRQGLARALVEEGMHRALREGARTLFLEVAEDNHAARALYESLGFHLTGRRKFYYIRPSGAHSDALVLRLALAG